MNIKVKCFIYSCRWCRCFVLQASRGSRDESPDTSHNSLQLCCADKRIGHEPKKDDIHTSINLKTVKTEKRRLRIA